MLGYVGQIDEARRNALIYQLQKQRLDYARFHVQKVALLKQISDQDNHFNSQLLSHSPTNTPVPATPKSPPNYSVKVRRSSDPSNNPSNDHLPQPDPFTDPPSEIVSTTSRYTTASTICDTLSHALAFFTSKEGRTSPFDHLEDTNTSSKVEEIILLGQGFEGASASSTLERKERIVDQRKVVDEQVHFVHEHIRSYRLETVLNLAGSEILDQIKVGEQRTAEEKTKYLEDTREDGEVNRNRPTRWEDQPVMFQKDAEWSRTTPVKERAVQEGIQGLQGSGQRLVDQPADLTTAFKYQEDQCVDQQLSNQRGPIVHTESISTPVREKAVQQGWRFRIPVRNHRSSQNI
uniref:Uncharacterized protein n=1 Tax=Ditylenchus dipsaci TaxID=166011 RepID=A0A915ERA9_9BILA